MNRPISGSGTSQQDRSSPALERGYFDVDELRFEDLLAIAADYARALKYYDLNNLPNGDWEPFFSSDEAVVIARILTTDLANAEASFFDWIDRDLSLFRAGADLDGYDVDKVPAYGLALKMDSWLNELRFNQLRANENDEAEDLSQRIERVIDGKLRDEMDSLGAFLAQFNVPMNERADQDLGVAWSTYSQAIPLLNIVPLPFQDAAGRDRIERFLTLNFYSFYHGITFLKTNAESLLPASMTNGGHSPDVGLYIAFAKLYERAQEKVNRFTQRHLGFYYDDVLRVRSRKALPDSAYLVFSPDVAERKVFVDEGTEFLAGVDANNNDVIYAADNDLTVTGAKVAALSTLYFERDPLKSPEHELGFISGAKSNRIPVVAGNGIENDRELAAWPLFGAPKRDLEEDFSEDASIGFAIASPVLFLKEGERQVEFTFKIEYTGISRFNAGDFSNMAGLLAKLRDATDAVSAHLQERFSDDFRQQLQGYDGSVPSTSELQHALIAELNQLLQGDTIYDAETFENVSLSPGTQLLVSRYARFVLPGRFNRQLLEEAYPDEIIRSHFLDNLLESLAEISRYSSKEDAFFKAFREMFLIHLTTESGWYEVPEYLPLGYVVDQSIEKDVIKIHFDLPPNVVPVVSYSPDIHGGSYDTDLPIARFTINPNSYLYPYSLLNEVTVKEIGVKVQVDGVRDALLYNNLGQLDPNSPFNPFGPIPSVGSYLIVGNEETARKQVKRFEVDVEWGDLPTGLGGFQEYYADYETPYYNTIFRVNASVLRDGRWMPAEQRDQPELTLFESGGTRDLTGDRTNIKYKRLSLGADVTTYFKPVEPLSDDEVFGYSSHAKNGFFKFTLGSPEYAFGHKDYPALLTRVLTENARLKHPKLFRSIPNAPYTPLINAISINYEAESSINLEQITSSNERMFKERLFHIHPFGVESISPLVYRNISLLPRYDEAGNLFIGLSASQLSGTLTLLYHLREDCAPEAGEQPTEAVWYYLSSNRWIAMASSDVISDTTNGFLSTGIVTLNIPDDVHIGNTVMPDDMFWLRVSVEKNPQYLCSLYSVHAQALQVTWQPPGTDAALSHGKLPAGTIKEPRVSIAGIGKINQIIDSFGGSPPESADRVKTRISERLRHKNRTLLSWDYERLILERFPDLRMVKCFPNMQSNPETPTRPGHILIVVVPEPKEQPVVHMRPMVNGLVISEISEFARKLSSPFAIIEVRNPAYEQVQVRCTVKFTREATGGHYINLLNQAISDYVSPWNASVGYGAKFGWSIRRYDIESFIRGLEYVEFVTNFSMLHIADDDSGYYHLFDTVHGRREEDEVRPLFPWSIAVPTRRHFVETTDHLVTIQAEQTGIDELRIGSTFIITDVNDNGTEE